MKVIQYKENKQIKKILLSIIFMILTVNLIPKAYSASTPTSRPSQNQISSDSAELEKIQKIKDIVASKVAELKLVEKRGFIASVKDISHMQITAVDLKGNTRHIDIDELTKFNVNSKSTSGISDLEKGKSYSFIGLYNKETQKLLARSIGNINTVPTYFEGALITIDDKNYQIELVNEKGEKKTIDIQNSTRTSLAGTNGDLLKSGFSKLDVNTRVLAVGFPDKKDENLISALRVIHFQDIPPSKEMQSYVKLPTPTPTQTAN